MRLYNAGFVASNFDKNGNYYKAMNDNEKAHHDANPYRLESYHYIGKKSLVEKTRNDGNKVFLDSGAFSAFSLGISVDIGQFCDYCHENADFIDQVSVLDAIGDYKGTFHNQREMEKRGVMALPCYHYGEPYDVGLHYADNYEYITLGGLVPISTQQMIMWLDEIFERVLTRPDGQMKCKVHGFGVTSLPVMLRYPWFSVDSSTWVQWGAFGSILLPESGFQINISARSSATKQWGRHFDTFTKPQQEAIRDEIERNGGSVERMRDINYSRWAWNAWAFPQFLNLRLEGKSATFTRPQPGLF